MEFLIGVIVLGIVGGGLLWWQTKKPEIPYHLYRDPCFDHLAAVDFTVFGLCQRRRI